MSRNPTALSSQSRQSEKLFECKRCTILICLEGLYVIVEIGYTSTRETAVHHSDWLYRLFSRVKIKRTDFCKLALRNKTLVFRVIKDFINCTMKGKKESFKVLAFLTLLEVGLFNIVVRTIILKKISRNENIKWVANKYCSLSIIRKGYPLYGRSS